MQIKGVNIKSKTDILIWGTYKVSKKVSNPRYPAKVTTNPFADLNIDYVGVV